MKSLYLLLVPLLFLGTSCQWLKNEVAGESFPSWNSSLGTNLRGEPSKNKPSGFFFDKKSQEIEQSLGGGF